jgi:hypothetical protein
MDKAEIEAIKKFNSNDKSIGYNLTSGGDGAPIGNTFMKGHHHTKKSRKKMARAHKGLKLGPQGTDHRDKISRALTGIVRGPMSEEIKREKSISTKKSWEERRKKYGSLGSTQTRSPQHRKTVCVICDTEISYRPNGIKWVPKTCCPECYSELRRRILKKTIN